MVEPQPADRDKKPRDRIEAELDAYERELEQLARAEPGAQGESQELRVLEEGLERARRVEQEVLAQVATMQDEPSDLAALQSFEQALRARPALCESPLPPAPRASRGFVIRLLTGVALAAAASLLAVHWMRPEQPTSVQMMGTGALEVRPNGRVARYTPFEWNLNMPVGGYFLVTIESDMPGEEGAPALEKREVEAPELLLTPQEEASLPDRIRFSVTACDAFGASTGAVLHGAAQRSSD